MDWSDVERELAELPEVTGVRLVTDQYGELTEVHVLATPDKHPKQIVRDLQAVAKVRFDVDLDHRIVSVVQLNRDQVSVPAVTTTVVEHDRDETEGGDRVLVGGISVARNDLRCTVEVALTYGDERFIGSIDGSSSSRAVPALVARATLGALAQHHPGAARIDLESVAVQRLGDRPFVAVSLVLLLPPHEETLFGCALVRHAGEEDAVARAVLDALNRRLAFVG